MPRSIFLLFVAVLIFLPLAILSAAEKQVTENSEAANYSKYCEVGGGCDEYISRVVVENGFDNSSGCEGYGQFTHLKAYVVYQSSYNITIEIGAAYGSDSAAVWIDWNHDYDFDEANELVPLNPGFGLGPYSGTITVPADAELGLTILRVRLCYNCTPQPCGITTYGELEDYMVEVTAGPEFVCGDTNGDSNVDLADASFLVTHIFYDGSDPIYSEAGDPNCDGDINLADVIFLINYIFKDGPSPCHNCF